MLQSQSSQISQNMSLQQAPSKVKTLNNVNNKLYRNWIMYALFVQKDFDNCLNLIEEIQKQLGDNHEFSNYLKGLILRQKGTLPKALECFKKCHFFNEKNSEVLKHISRTLFLMGKHKASIEVANEALVINPNDWELYFTQGQAYLNMKQYDKSLIHFQKANDISKHDQTFLELGKIYVLSDKYKEAIEIYKQGLEHSIENTELMTILGLLYLRMGDNIEAFQYFGSALSLDPKDTRSILGVSSIMQDRSEYDASLLRYRTMAIINPNSPNLWNNIGMCFYGKKKYIACIACLKKALYLDPFQWITCLNLGLVYYQTQQYASAFHFFTVSINLKPEMASSFMYLGLCLYKLDDFPNSCNAFEKGLELEQDYLIYLNYALILARYSQCHDKAREMMVQFESKFNYVEDDTRINLEEVLEQRENLNKLLNLNLQKYSKKY